VIITLTEYGETGRYVIDFQRHGRRRRLVVAPGACVELKRAICRRCKHRWSSPGFGFGELGRQAQWEKADERRA
jgi:hypothetical protein